jgi:hypothetical protein
MFFHSDARTEFRRTPQALVSWQKDEARMVSPDARPVPLQGWGDRPSCPPEGEHASSNFDPLVLMSGGAAQRKAEIKVTSMDC